MTYYKWNHDKNERLKAERGVGFEQVMLHIERGDLIDVVEHPNQSKYPNQKMLVVKIKEYAYLVPFAEDEDVKFLKGGIHFTGVVFKDQKLIVAPGLFLCKLLV